MIPVAAETNEHLKEYASRWWFVLALLFVAMVTLICRSVELQVIDRQFLQHQGDLRHINVVSVPANRGKVLDRQGELLALSTPVKSIAVNPKEFEASPQQLKELAGLLGLDYQHLLARVSYASGRTFVYLKRRMDPAVAEQVKAMDLPGVYFEREFRRYYPVGEVASHILGFTNIDDNGQEGLELAYNKWLRGATGQRRVIRDGKQRIIEDVEDVRPSVPGKDLVLSIDQRLQYLAYRELKSSVLRHNAKAGSLVLLDAKSGEIMAMVNQPSFNPNNRKEVQGSVTRNRAVTDSFEPGSVMKPFAVACALELGMFRPDTMIDTNPGTMMVAGNVVRDIHNYGVLDVAHVLQKSSNVGVTKIALSLPADRLWGFVSGLGFGEFVGLGFPGESAGRLRDYKHWGQFEQATLSFGYGVSTSTLQLARAYTAIANNGMLPHVSLLKAENKDPPQRAMSSETALKVRTMLEQVVSREGTALRASVSGYRVAGKTGTVKKSAATGGYTEGSYLSLFVGMAPASDPKLVMVVMIDEPSAGEYYGGSVAAPVFSTVMSGALRLLNVAPDQQENAQLLEQSEGTI
ncbi:penicillin-binding protein 3 [Methylogaea oryzae]|uniref:Peptidoglycan D,D-transpeptidase FtsI n=1 Tax=Methylogaea oryzae TaxID=1295382 RepID=A0A8D4VR90_9GAMM|nr:penicillin-binding protein 3 [Methylogaea oryzae]